MGVVHKPKKLISQVLKLSQPASTLKVRTSGLESWQGVIRCKRMINAKEALEKIIGQLISDIKILEVNRIYLKTV